MRHVIYLRTSTYDQEPENQLNACLQFCRSRGYVVDPDRDIIKEHISAWKKEVKREGYEEIKRLVHIGEVKSVTVWALDRWVRNRETLLDDLAYLANRGVKLHSVQEPYLESLNIEGPLGSTLREFLYGLVGSLGQIESDRKSARIREAYANRKRKWGRPEAQFNQYRAYELLFNQKLSQRAVAQEMGVSVATICRFKRAAEKNPALFIKGVTESKGVHSVTVEGGKADG